MRSMSYVASPGSMVVEELFSDRLRLRPFTHDDAPLLFELDNDPQVMKFINGGVPVSLPVIRNEILPTFLTPDPVAGFRVVESRDSGIPLGWCCLRGDAQPEAQASLGYRFLQRVWGNGYAVESASLLLDAGFASGLERAIATTYEDNRPSIRVLETLGFELKLRFRADLEDQETAVFDST